ncbi:hypothetical protein [Curtobacterium sp. MCSS17_016]|uniref:hypothetical protein n=1 Tax=Curtobacterium sp. MCSS17_016 TaxID=2175644 RepID=UPI000DA83AF4|nr:hypothetical protein [Curtobacterium sp. MCSS17_016]WIE81358.1 hypothetical protein DEJ19_019175 [Curtobacterium sp. MCSS17_016]
MHRNTIDVIQDASADRSYYRQRRIVVTIALGIIAVSAAVLGFVIDDPALLGKLFRYVAGGVLFLAIANVITTTLDLRNIQQVIDDAEAGGLH